MANHNQPESNAPTRLKKRSYMGEVWHQLKKNKVSMICIVFVVILLLGIIFAEAVSPYDYAAQNLMDRFLLPSLAHPMGTDDFGRDLLTRLLVGGRYTLLIALVSVAIGMGIGMVIGAMCGFFGKWVDTVLMRLMDVILSIPGLMLTIVISVALGSGVFNTALALAVGTVPRIARQLRSSTMLINGQEYIEAARSFGESNTRIILTHVIPNTMAPIIVQASLNIGGAILGIAGLSFLGLGVQAPTPEWGNILNNGLTYIYDFSSRWHVIFFPALFIVLSELAFNLLGDGLRDAMDPRMRK